MQQHPSSQLLMSSGQLGSLLMLAVLVQAGCAPTAERAAEGAAPAGIQASLEALNEEENRRQFVELVADAGEAAASGAFRRVMFEVEQQSGDGNAGEWLIELIERITHRAAVAVRQEMSEMTPELQEAAGTAMAEALDEMLTSRRREQAALMADAVMRSAMQAMIETGATGLREELGPVLEHLIKEHVAAGRRHTAEQEVRGRVETLAEPEVQAAVSEAARNESRARVAGTHDALVEREVLLSAGQGMFEEARRTLSMWLMLAVAGFGGLALLMLVSALVLGVLIIRGRRAGVEAEAAVEHRRAALLTDAVREAEGRPWGPELVEIVRERFRRADVGDPPYGVPWSGDPSRGDDRNRH